MKKRLISLLLAMVMLLSLCMTACSSEEESETAEEDEPQRPNIALTIYAVTDDSTTAEGLAAVEEKVSNYCVAKYKTAIDLRFVTEKQYQKQLEDMYQKFAEEEEAKKAAEAEAKKKAKEEAAYKATLTPEEKKKYEQQKRLEAKKKAEEAEKLEQEKNELIEQGKDVAVLKDVQMDIIYIPTADAYYKNIEEGLLTDLTTFLSGTYKNVRDYVYPSFMTAATVNGQVFGIPNNHGVTTEETYFVVNSALAEKYNVDWTKVRSIEDLEPVFAQIRANERGVTPILGDFAPEDLVYYTETDMANSLCVFFDTLPAGKFTAENAYSALNPNSAQSSAFVDYCALKAKWRNAGYLSENNANFFLAVEQLSAAEKKQFEEEGYSVILYKGAEFTTEAAFEYGLFGISKFCQYPERAMEILRLFSCDSEFKNLITFGVEETHYIKTAGEENMITVIDDSYSMDYFTTGNALIGYVTDKMDSDFIEISKEKNRNSRISPFLGFRYEWTKAEDKYLKAFGEWKSAIDARYDQLVYGTNDYLAILTEIYNEIYNNPDNKFSASYQSFQNDCGFRNAYKAYAPKLVTLSNTLIVPEEPNTPKAAPSTPAAPAN